MRQRRRRANERDLFLETTFGHFGLVVLYHFFETHAHRPARLPVERLLCASCVRPAFLGIVLGQTLVNNVEPARLGDSVVCALNVLHDLTDELRKLENAKLVTIAEVDGSLLGRVHERDQAVDEIVYVLERTGLRSVAVYGQVFAAKRLHDEVGHHAAVVWVHCMPNRTRMSG
jgi:hypothetical protein